MIENKNKLNIKEMVFKDPVEIELFLKPKDFLRKEDADTIDHILTWAKNDPLDYFQFLYCLKTIVPERFENESLHADDFIKLKQHRNRQISFSNFEDAGNLTASILLTYPEERKRFQLSKSRFNEMIYELEVAKRGGLWSEFTDRFVTLKIIDEATLEDAYPLDQSTINTLVSNKNLLLQGDIRDYIDSCAKLRIIFPDSKDLYTPDANAWKRMSKVLQTREGFSFEKKCETEEEFDTQLTYFSLMKNALILSAGDIRLSDTKGLELITKQVSLTDEQKSDFPLVRRF
jgi:hypothetical protein